MKTQTEKNSRRAKAEHVQRATRSGRQAYSTGKDQVAQPDNQATDGGTVGGFSLQASAPNSAKAKGEGEVTTFWQTAGRSEKVRLM